MTEAKPLRVRWIDNETGSGWAVLHAGQVTHADPDDTKKETFAEAKEQARDNGFFAVVLENTDATISKVWWNRRFNEIRVVWDESAGKWRAFDTFEGQQLGSSSKRGKLVDRMKKKQKEQGFRYLTIERKDETVYWKRQHPLWRRAPER